MMSASWFVKLTKFCDLRCSYCYEWNELGDPRKMPLEVYERALTAIATYERHLRKRSARVESNIVFDGGEPFIVGPEYFARLRALSLTRLPRAAYGVQTNLYSLEPWQIAEMKAFPLRVGVSFDVHSGIRRTASGADSEERVFENLLSLAGNGLDVDVSSVIGAHNVDGIGDLLAAMNTVGLSVRLLPVSEGPAERPSGFEAAEERIVDALEEAAILRLDGSVTVEVAPVDAYIRIAVATVLGLETPRFERGVNTGGAFVIERDGRILLESALDEPPVGHVMEDDVGQDAFAARLLERARDLDRRRLARICGGCRYRSTCEGCAAITNGPAQDGQGCRYARAVIDRLVANMDTPDGRAGIQRGLKAVLAGEDPMRPLSSFAVSV